MKKSLIFKRSK